MYVLIPSYEPKNNFINLIKEIKNKTDYKILVIDDGSGKKYNEIFNEIKKLDVELITHSKNLGKGQALKTGFEYILNLNNNDAVVCADCDGQHMVEDIVKVANRIKENEMIIGVRKFKGKIPIKSLFGNKITSMIFAIFTGKYISDTQTGLRGYSYSTLKKIYEIKGDRFEYEINTLLKAKEKNISIVEVPIVTIYENNNKGTHFKAISDSIKIYLPLLKFGSSSVISAIVDFILLLIFNKISNNLLFSVVLSRILSSIFNYTINKNIVFGNYEKNKYNTALKYFLLVIVIMILNYFLLNTLNNIIGLNIVISKILTESILFILSYTLQKECIFKNKDL